MKTVRTRSVEPCEWPVRCGCLTAFTAERSDLRGYTYGYESEGLEHVEEVSYVRCPRCRAMHIVSMRDALRKADETPFPRWDGRRLRPKRQAIHDVGRAP